MAIRSEVKRKAIAHDGDGLRFENLGECLSAHRIWAWEKDGYLAVPAIEKPGKYQAYVLERVAEPDDPKERQTWVAPVFERRPVHEVAPRPVVYADAAEVFIFPESVVIAWADGSIKTGNILEACAYLKAHELQVVRVEIAQKPAGDAQAVEVKGDMPHISAGVAAPPPSEIRYSDPGQAPRFHYVRKLSWTKRTYPGNPYAMTRLVKVVRVKAQTIVYGAIVPKVVNATGVQGERHFADEAERKAEVKVRHELMVERAAVAKLKKRLAELEREAWLRKHLSK